eukprot:TRINITY_DN6981_c0_g1_i10.p1 TRINITY_DN6981_c0_g1~~TRINITY_DN6981_c0_g1_i10.p1  ORF type:complete len:197 (+),score=32.62 TRINITY_DN6981_c0_g1_i10:78-593(+)
MMSTRSKTVTKNNFKIRKHKDKTPKDAKDSPKVNKTVTLLHNFPYKMQLMRTMVRLTKTHSDSQSTFVNKVPKSVVITPVKWKFNVPSSAMKVKRYGLSHNNEEVVLMQEKILEALLRYLPYEQLITCHKFFPFCKKPKHSFILKRVLLFQFIYVQLIFSIETHKVSYNLQ